MQPIAVFHSPFKEKFGIPRQAGIISSLPGSITFVKEWQSADAVRGLEDFDYIWLLWQCHERKSNTVRPPRLGGNTQIGIFASRSPYRPNPIALSSVKISRIDLTTTDGPVINVLGADLMDGTLIYDIKPYIPYTDAHPEARAGFTDKVEWHSLHVSFTQEAEKMLTQDTDKQALSDILSQDPRPHYHNNPTRIYGMSFGNHNVKFRVEGDELIVIEIEKRK